MMQPGPGQQWWGANAPTSYGFTPSWASNPYWHVTATPFGGWGFNPYGAGTPAGTFVPSYTPIGGLGGLRRWGGTYTPQFTSTGLPTDEEIEEMVYDGFDNDWMIPPDANIDVEVDAGEVTLTGTVPNKTIKHHAGDIAWWTTGVTDVHNEIKVSGPHRHRREGGAGAQRPMERGPARTRPGR